MVIVVFVLGKLRGGLGQSPGEELYRGDVDPRFGAGDRRLEILGQAAVWIEPREGSFNNPAAGQQMKAGSLRGAFDDLDRPMAEFAKGVNADWRRCRRCRRTDGATRETTDGWPR